MRRTALALGLIAALVSAPQAAEPRVDPRADALVRRMSDLLAGTKTFEFRVTDVFTRPRSDGTKKELRLSREILVRRPDGARMKIHGESRDVVLWYDAGKLALQSEREKVYARAEIPANIDEAMDFIGARFRLPMPLADVLYGSPYDALVSADTSGRFVGPGEIEGEACTHLAFQDPVVDWEIWIRDGDRALPCRLRIVYKLAEGAPEALVTFSDWDLAPRVAANAFNFEPPADFRQIRIAAPARE